MATIAGRRFLVPSVSCMEQLGAVLAKERCAGDIIFLNADIGMGKSCLARGYLKSALGDDNIRVPSPTFLLMNSYHDGNASSRSLWIHHMDFYRLPSLERADYDTFELEKKIKNGKHHGHYHLTNNHLSL